MKKNTLILTVLSAFAGCSMIEPMLSKEYIAEDIKGEALPAALDGLTLVYGETELRFTNGYIALKGSAYNTYAARIVKIFPAGASEYKFFISEGRTVNGQPVVKAFYLTNTGIHIYGNATLIEGLTINSPFPQIHDGMGSSENKLYLNNWAVDEKHKPLPLEGSYHGAYKNKDNPMVYHVSATGIAIQFSGSPSREEKILRIAGSGTERECYTASNAYKLTADGKLYSGSPASGGRYTPASTIDSWHLIANK